MNAHTLDAAITEAERFLAEAKALQQATTTAERGRSDPDSMWWPPSPLVGSIASGTVKRRSMDLTRALADLRRPS